VRDQQVGIQTLGRTRIDPQLLEGDRALRNTARMLDHQHVARHEVRTGDSRQLIIREIPGFHTEDDPDGAALHVRLADGRVQLHGREKLLRMLRVVGEDLGTEFHFTARLTDPLAHFDRHRVREFVDFRLHDGRRPVDDDRAFGVALLTPYVVAGRRSGDLLLELRVGDLFEGFDEFSRGGIEALITHDVCLFDWNDVRGGRRQRIAAPLRTPS
jgi:hypothetical protein